MTGHFTPPTRHCEGPRPIPPKCGSGVRPPPPEFNPYEAIMRLVEAQSRAYDSLCEVNLKMLKAEAKLGEIRFAIDATNKHGDRSEFHRGWCGACDYLLAVLDRNNG